MSIYRLKDIYSCVRSLKIGNISIFKKEFEKRVKINKKYKKFSDGKNLILYKILPHIKSMYFYSKKQKSYHYIYYNEGLGYYCVIDKINFGRPYLDENGKYSPRKKYFSVVEDIFDLVNPRFKK